MTQKGKTEHADRSPVPSQAEADHDTLRKLEALFAAPTGDFRTVLLREMVSSVLKLNEYQLDLLNIKILNRALKELRHAFKVFDSYSHCPKVSIYGSARLPPGDLHYQLAFRFAQLLSQRGYMVITGAGEGIMQAGHEGAGRENSFGVNIMLPFEQAPNTFIVDDPKLVHLKYFFTRKLLFVKESHATALFAGGFGTLDEGFEVLTLIQTGKTNPTPVVCLQAPGDDYWDRWRDFLADQLLPRGLISETDLSLFKIFDHEVPAVEEILGFYRSYHSIRFIGDRLVIRIKHSLHPDQLVRVNEEFKDLLVTGSFEQQGPFDEKVDEPDLSAFSRLVFHYDRRSAGRLRQLIDWLNSLPASAAASSS